MELKEIIPNLNKRVIYDGYVYTLVASTVMKDEYSGALLYTADLLDKNKNSVCHARLEDVTVGKENF